MEIENTAVFFNSALLMTTKGMKPILFSHPFCQHHHSTFNKCSAKKNRRRTNFKRKSSTAPKKAELAEAQRMYSIGKRSKKFKEAIKWFQKSIKLFKCQYILGVM